MTAVHAVFHRPAFERLDPRRRSRVLDEAVREFAARGFQGASVNTVAREAGISVGGLYRYFASKEDLYLAVVNLQADLLDGVLAGIDPDRPLRQVLHDLLVASREAARTRPDLSRIYQDISSQALSEMASRLSGRLEKAALDFLMRALLAAKARGELPASADERGLAFVLDNQLVQFQFAFASDYHRERARLFLGEEALSDDEGLVERILDAVGIAP